MPYVEIPRGALIHYVDLNLRGEWDPSPGPPVVLIHGLGCTWEIWRRQIGWLANARRVIALDVRGSGRSKAATGPWTTADMAADVRAVVAQAAAHRPTVVGISMGGMIALQYAADYPGELERLVVYATLPGTPEEFARSRRPSDASSNGTPWPRSPRNACR